MASMSYCMNHNTNIEMAQIISRMQNHDTIEEYVDSLSDDERRSFYSLVDKCRDVVEYMEECEC